MAKTPKDTGPSALELALGSIEKSFGKGSIMRLGDNISLAGDIVPIPTGSIGIDVALGIGGYARGRIVEIYGPESSGKTTLTLHAIAEAQKQGGVCAFIDAEHALDVGYAQNLGVDVDNLLLSQPDCGEQAMEIADTLVRSGAVDLVVVDSVAALTPKAELMGEMGDSHVGLQARLMSQALRKLNGNLSKSNTCMIFINQIRMKIGVMFGCFHYDTLVNFSDGRSIPIGDVVDQKIKGNVYCLNEKTREIEEKPITGWHDNGKVEDRTDFIHIQTESINGGGRFGFTCTPNHEILTDSGWRQAKNLSYDDKLISKYKKTVSSAYEKCLKGILIGDSHISVRSNNTACLKLQDNNNLEYVNWKLDLLDGHLSFNENEISRGYMYSSKYTYELAKIKKELKNRDPMYMLNDYSDIGLAIWIMDDGHLDLSTSHKRYTISIKRFKNNNTKLLEIKNKLTDLGYPCAYRLESGSIVFTKQITIKIADRIKKLIPGCMQYKLPEEYRGFQYKSIGVLSDGDELVPEYVQIKEIRFASPRQMRNKRKFDISVKDNQNYMVGGKYNGIIVHNSPETTPGGRALKFYASQRLDIRRIGALKKGEDVYGNRTRVKIVKNKLASPFKEIEFDIVYGKGVSQEGSLIDMGVDDEIVDKSGAWFSYDGTRIGQGRDNARQFLIDNPKITAKIHLKLRELHGLSNKNQKAPTASDPIDRPKKKTSKR